jgi:hypothetical protein
MAKMRYDPARKVPLSPQTPVEQPRRLAWPVTGARVTYWICTNEVTEAIMHYVAPRTAGCGVFHGDGTCPLCKQGLNRFQTWWIQASLEEGIAAQVELLQLTANALKSEPHLLGSNGYLWGRRLTVWRFPGGPKDPMYAEMDMDVTPKNLPKVEPTINILIRRWQAATSAAVIQRQGRGGDGKSLGGEGEERGGRDGA